MRLSGTDFVNSATCRGVSFSSNTPHDLAKIEITGRYPEKGWARNSESHEIVYVLNGRGSVVIRNEDETLLEPSDVIHIPPGKQFAWNGDMTILMTCSPAFNLEQYEIEEEKV